MLEETARLIAALEAIRGKQHDLEEEIRRLLKFALAQPEGEIRTTLIDTISALDAITDVIRQALDLIP